MNKNNIIIGLAAGVASGKTSISQYLNKNNFTIIKTSRVIKPFIQGTITSRKQYWEIFNEKPQEINKLILNKIKSSLLCEKIVIDSIRQKSLHLSLKLLLGRQYKLIYINTPLNHRFDLNKKRQRFAEDINMSFEKFVEYLDLDNEKDIIALQNYADLELSFSSSQKQREKVLEKYLIELLKFSQ